MSGQVTQPHLDLKAPPPLPEGGLRVMALGGLGEIGRNMAVLEFDGQLLVIDCGVLFPEAEQPGVDLILPDFGVIEHRLDDIDAVVLTHGHEDHIGAIPYLLRLRGDIPLVGSRFTLALVARQAARAPDRPDAGRGRRRRRPPGRAVPLRVHLGQPLDPRRARRRRAHAGRARSCTPATSRWTSCRSTASSPTWAPSPGSALAGIDLLLSDSTNAEMPGFVTPERSIGPVLDDVFARATQRLIVSSFASHVHRIQQVLDCAETHRRKVALVGRSMVRNMGVARDLGLLRVAPGLMVSLDEAAAMPPEQVVLVSTGSQGEPLSALGRMARGEHHQVTIEAGDTVVLASSLVPGNETAVYKVINGLARLGATVVHKETARVHVSGHAPAGELRTLLNVAKPRYLMPVHGEWRHLRAHAALAEETGMAPRPGDPRRGRRRRGPGRRQGLDRGQRADRQRLRRRAQRRRRRRGVAAGPADPRRRGLRGADRRHRAVDPHDRAAGAPVAPAGFSDDPAAFDEVLHLVEDNLKRALQDDESRPAPAVADHPPDGRQVGVGHVPPSPDDHPDGPRGLTGTSHPTPQSR